MPIAWIRTILPSTPFARGVSLLAGGTAGSQALLMLAAPLLTRLYTPDLFGLLAVYTSLLGMFLSVSTLCYEEAIVLPECDRDAANIAALCMSITVIVVVLCSVVLHSANQFIARELDAGRLVRYLWLLPLGLLLAGFTQIMSLWAMRHKQFSLVAQSRMVQTVITLTLQLGAYRLAVLALLLGHTLGQAASLLTLNSGIRRRSRIRGISLSGMRQAAWRYRNFPYFSTLSNLLDTGGRELPTILFAMLFSPGAAGLYALANRVLAMPMTVLGSAIAHVLLANAPQAHRDGELGSMVAIVYGRLSHIAMPAVLALMMVAPDLFALVFGQEWREAGLLAQCMAPWLYMRFVASPLSTLIPALEKQREGLVFYAAVFALRIIAIVIGGLSNSLTMAVVLLSLASVLSWGAYLIWITGQIGNSIRNLAWTSLSSLGWGLLCIAPLIANKLYLNHDGTWMVALLMTGLLISLRIYYLLRQIY
ncbi:lipopolysaccharide biosynthesis protein [Allopusillimonas soli]|uniref:Oligosaccharide flippase family protein n=1 Tax=Allopusillimonas soli TaxID=659016 RepID=A0A853FKQ4_9BURK|nr:oligosaccharide flippase family protein [Allopusillimonas soli]NYT38951.1 oligosaccharide flippase family protein [Allopusillimonas soli]TEA70055.1 lipopolysaccharide biosynthesis protein [Allopusillimonas soli]